MILYHVERLADVFDEIQPMLENHWQEIALHKDSIELNVNWPAYERMDEDGRLHICTAREGDKLIGYFVNIIVPHLHYQDHLFSHNDVIYVDPEYRKGFTAWRLIKFATEQLTIAGVSVMMINIKRHKPFDQLLRRLKFTETESIYSKRLGAT